MRSGLTDTAGKATEEIIVEAVGRTSKLKSNDQYLLNTIVGRNSITLSKLIALWICKQANDFCRLLPLYSLTAKNVAVSGGPLKISTWDSTDLENG